MAIWYFGVFECELEPAFLCAPLGGNRSRGVTCTFSCSSVISAYRMETKSKISGIPLALFDLDADRNFAQCVFVAMNAVLAYSLTLFIL